MAETGQGSGTTVGTLTGPAEINTDGAETAAPAPRRRPALSPSRASDFKQCPLLYRFRAIDRLPETPTRVQVRGIVVHSVLERLFGLPAADRDPAHAKDLLPGAWADLQEQRPELTVLFDGAEETEVADWLDSARALLDGYFTLEDPRRFDAESCELRVETELASGLLLRGFIDRLDVAPTGEIRVVDYKTGAAPREIAEAKALFQMKFYALAVYRLRGVVPKQLRLMYLADQQSLVYTPDEGELLRFERTLDAVWEAILRAGKTGEFRPNPGRLCDWCDHKALCPAYGGTPPPYPGWPEPDENTGETPLDRAD